MIFDVILIRIIWTVYQPFLFVKYYFKKKLSAEGKSWLRILAGISSRTYNSIPSPFLLRSNLKGVWNPSIKNWPCGKLSSSFDSDIMKTSIDPSICSQRKSNLVLSKLMFKFPKTNLLILLVPISLRIRLAFVTIVIELQFLI